MKKCFMLLLPVFLASCSYLKSPGMFKTHDKQYLSAKSIPPLRIPPGLSSDAIQSTYPVSERTYAQESADVSLVPPGLK